MAQAVETKFHGPSNRLGSRYSATALYTGKRVYVAADHALNSDDNHRAAFLKLAATMRWDAWSDVENWHAGGAKQGAKIWVWCEPAREGAGSDA